MKGFDARFVEQYRARRAAQSAGEPAPAPPAEGWGAACADYEEFFLRTRSENPLTDSEKILRYIEKVVILDEEVEVHFKAGIVFRL